MRETRYGSVTFTQLLTSALNLLFTIEIRQISSSEDNAPTNAARSLGLSNPA